MSADDSTPPSLGSDSPVDAAPRIDTLVCLLLDAAATYRGTALVYPDGERWGEMSYPALGEAVRQVARGLIALGVQPGDRVAILSNTRSEWTIADVAIMCAGAVVVPVYQTNSPEECHYVLEHSGAAAIFCEDAGQVAKLAEIRDELPRLRHVIRFEGASDGALTLAQLREQGWRDPGGSVRCL